MHANALLLFFGILTNFGLTVTGPDAFGPCVIKPGVADISTVLKPGTVGTATTGLARFLGAALPASYGRCDDRFRTS